MQFLWRILYISVLLFRKKVSLFFHSGEKNMLFLLDFMYINLALDVKAKPNQTRRWIYTGLTRRRGGSSFSISDRRDLRQVGRG
jgi:hypothetical protein